MDTWATEVKLEGAVGRQEKEGERGRRRGHADNPGFWQETIVLQVSYSAEQLSLERPGGLA